jgi:hypothetical protein
MSFKTRSTDIAAALVLICLSRHGRSQAPKISLDRFLSQSVSDAQTSNQLTISEWMIRHPDEVVEQGTHDPDSQNTWDGHDKDLQKHWCIRSTGEVSLIDGVVVRRIALFYPPLVEQINDGPLPPLPSETGSSLRLHGCKLTRILTEFKIQIDPPKFAEDMVKRIPWKGSDDSNALNQSPGDSYWTPFYEFSGNHLCSLLIHRPLTVATGTEDSTEQPSVLLDCWAEYSDYGSISTKTIAPEAGEPWLALRAAMLAHLPEDATLKMLSFLAPQTGEQF